MPFRAARRLVRLLAMPADEADYLAGKAELRVLRTCVTCGPDAKKSEVSAPELVVAWCAGKWCSGK
jgi:hypothetical protein